ncbi:hypothetical protein JL720_11449 [Aureococcus anophagefferens]|nr:hypothetical protein JL720_11449 [Aureococcus anophagefferens]
MGASQSARCLGALDEPEKKLKAPGQYERLHDDAKRVTAVNTFEGAKFEYGTLEGQFYGVVAGALQGKFIFNLPKDPKGFVAVLDADYGGALAQLKVAQNIHGVAGPHCGCAYMQAVTPRWSLGGEGACALAGPSATASFAAKYAGKKWTGVAAATRSGSGAIADQLAFSYARVVSPQRVTLGAELVVQAGGEATYAAGAEFALKQSRVNVALGYNDAEPGKHRDHFKFGYALQIGQ